MAEVLENMKLADNSSPNLAEKALPHMKNTY